MTIVLIRGKDSKEALSNEDRAPFFIGRISKNEDRAPFFIGRISSARG